MLRETRRPRKYGLALAAVLLAFLFTPLVRPFLEPTPFLLFVGATLWAAWFGGLGPGLLACFCSWLATEALSLALPGPPLDMARVRTLAVFVLTTALIGVLSSARRRAL